MSEESRELLLKALNIAEYETLKEKARRNEMVVHEAADGSPVCVPAREVFVQLYHEPVPTF